MSSPSFLQRVLAGFAATLDPLKQAAASPQAFGAFLGQFGWALSAADVAHATGAVTDLAQLPSDPSSLSVDQLTSELVNAAQAIRRISSSGAPAAFANTFPEELLDYLVYFAVAQQAPPLFALLHFGGVFTERRVPADTATGRTEYIERRVHWDRLGSLTSDPLGTIEQAYGWGTTFDGDGLLRSLGILLRGFGARAGMYPVDPQLAQQYYTRDNPALASLRNLIISLPFLSGGVSADSAAANIRVAFLALPIPPTAPAADPADGLALMPLITGNATDTIALSDDVTLSLNGDFLARPVRAEIHPNAAVLRATPGDSHVDAQGRVDAKGPGGKPWIPFGDAGSSRLEISAAHAAIGMSGELDGALNLKVEFGIDSGSLVIDLGGGDSFVTGAVGAGQTTSPVSLLVKWSSATGISFGGNPRLEVTIPLVQSIGIATIQNIGFALGAGDGGTVEFDATLSASTKIGPIAAAVSDMGLRIQLRFPDSSGAPGNLGNVNVDIGFKPPSGAGLSLDAAGVSGGGFLKYEDAKHQYSGMLQLQFTELALQAFALITTGSAGFSLLALLDGEFPPIQLGWGFTLDGVGGLVAVNRAASVDALRAALKADQLSTVLFPKNAAANAPQILSQLDAFFPAAPGRFLFGPMALIGWGTPTVLTAAIAVILELPEPIRMLLLARVAVRAPSEDEPLVRINMDALGVLDLGRGELSLDAVLYDSRLLDFTLSGSMALRATWAGEREFLLAIGGFHPRFTPPPGFPALQRITIDMPSGPIAKLRLAAYLAITSNSVQWGADLDVFIGVSEFGLAGHLGFDALLQFHPFHFEADISGKVVLFMGGDDIMSISLDATLSGPTPWHIAGKFTISLFLFDLHKSFSHTWGEDAPALSVPTVDVGQLLAATLADPKSWDTLLPDGTAALVTVRQVDAGTALLAHPLALPEVHERLVPLGLSITRFGDAAPAGATSFAITDWRLGGAMVTRDSIQDDFAPAQFFELSDDEKLERPSFERHDAGVRMSGSVVKNGSAVAKSIAYETYFVDEPGGALRTESGLPPQPLFPDELLTMLPFGSAARGHRGATRYSKYAAPGNPVVVKEPQFVVVNGDTLTPAGIGSAATFSEAAVLLAQHGAAAAGLQIVAVHETATAG